MSKLFKGVLLFRFPNEDKLSSIPLNTDPNMFQYTHQTMQTSSTHPNNIQTINSVQAHRTQQLAEFHDDIQQQNNVWTDVKREIYVSFVST